MISIIPAIINLLFYMCFTVFVAVIAYFVLKLAIRNALKEYDEYKRTFK